MNIVAIEDGTFLLQAFNYLVMGSRKKRSGGQMAEWKLTAGVCAQLPLGSCGNLAYCLVSLRFNSFNE